VKSYLLRNFCLCLVPVILAGCSTFKFMSRPGKEAPPPAQVGLNEYRGALHVHTYYPQDRKGIRKLGDIANKIGLDFVVVSDHNSLSALRDGKDGMYGNTLVIVGDEVSTDSGHLLVWGIEKPITSTDARKAAREIRAQGGVIFIAHPFAKDYRWKDWTFSDFDGIEVYNTQANALDEDFLSLVVRGVVLFPDEFYRSMIKVSPEATAKWDRLQEKRKVVGIGSTDAHESHGLPGFEVDSYNVMLKSVNCHVLAEDLTKDRILHAFRAGRLYFAFDIFANPRGFEFYLRRGAEKFHMGETVAREEGDVLVIAANRAATIRLFCDGKPLSEDVADRVEVPLRGKGVYRAEVYLNHKPWIFSNPVYVVERAPAPPGQQAAASPR